MKHTLKGLSAAAVLAALCAAATGCADKTAYPPVRGSEVAAHYEAPGAGDERTDELEEAYHTLLEQHTQHIRGVADHFDIPVSYDVAYLSWPLASAELKARAMRRIWDQQTYRNERARLAALHRERFVFRMALYTENTRENRLGTAEGAPWRVFLVMGEQRLAPARVRRISGQDTELAWLFPPLDRFEKLYEIEFERPEGPISAETPARLELTGFPDTTYSEWFLGRDPGPPAPAEAARPAAEPAEPGDSH